jgi:methylthioribose-1-phosphate isomerase
MYGIPGKAFAEFLKVHYPSGQWRLWWAESRPFETVVSERLKVFIAAGYETVVIGDNMIGFCIAQKKVSAVFVFYQHVTNEHACCQGGGLLVAVLAKELGVACNLYPTDFDSEKAATGDSLSFAGHNITPPGAKSYIPRLDLVPLRYFKEKW